jgi:hypothetical protein
MKEDREENKSRSFSGDSPILQMGSPLAREASNGGGLKISHGEKSEKSEGTRICGTQFQRPLKYEDEANRCGNEEEMIKLDFEGACKMASSESP